MIFNDVFRDFIYFRSYSRWLDNEGRREFWEESIQRYEDFFSAKVPAQKKKEFKQACEAKKNQEVMGSMRALWTAGKALDRDHLCLYNCGYTPIDSVKAFSELLYILLCGTGVGYSIERQYIVKLPEIPVLKKSDDVIVFADSKLGWAEGFHKFLKKLYSGKIPQYDLSKIRPKGAPLKTFGGRASGSQVLENLLKFTVSMFKTAQGRKLNSCECNDLCCFIASVVMVGGVRRSSCISLSNPSDDRMRHSKDGQFWKTHPYRSLANNSTAYTEKPSSDNFLSEFLSLIRSGSGERGIFNRESCEFIVQQNEYRKNAYEWGGNPCFTGDMQLLTVDGYKTLSDLVMLPSVNVVNAEGEVSEGRVWSNGVKPVFEVVFSGKRKNIKCTEDHVFKLNDGSSCGAKDLKGKRIMPYFSVRNIDKTSVDHRDFYAGFIFGDGCVNRLASEKHKGMEVFIGKKDSDVAEIVGLTYGDNYNRESMDIALAYGFTASKTYDRELPEELEITDDFLCGLFSANGTVTESACRVSLKTTSKKLALQITKEMSKRDIKTYITTNKKHFIEHSNGTYESKESYDVNIAEIESVKKYAETISFAQKYKQEKLERSLIAYGPFVTSVRFIGEEEVFDFSEPLIHWGVIEGVIAHNCMERILRPRGLCNLSEVIVRPEDDKDTLCQKVRQATILGCVQACYTDFNFISREWKKNAEEERLIGVSLTGVRDHKILNKVSKEAKLWLTEMKQVCIDTALEWSAALEINMPACQTCIKPSGSVSALTGTASGLHARFAQYYIRRVRVAAIDPIANFLIDKGVPYEPENGQSKENADTWVFEFPMKSPKSSVIQEEIGAIDQLEYWLMLQKHWCTGKPSCTIHVEDDEWVEVAAWVYKHWNYMSGVAFLPKSATVYELMPFEEISESEYKERLKDFPEVDFTGLTEYEETDRTTGAQELACSAGNCEIV